jgi:hypothetical protein
MGFEQRQCRERPLRHELVVLIYQHPAPVPFQAFWLYLSPGKRNSPERLNRVHPYFGYLLLNAHYLRELSWVKKSFYLINGCQGNWRA